MLYVITENYGEFGCFISPDYKKTLKKLAELKRDYVYNDDEDDEIYNISDDVIIDEYDPEEYYSILEVDNKE